MALKKLLYSFGLAMGFLCISGITKAAEVDSPPRKIGTIQTNGDILYMVTSGDVKWGAPGCPNASYASYTPASDAPGATYLTAPMASKGQVMFSLIQLAFATGKKVTFRGTCSADGGYFKVSYIFVYDN